MEMTVFACFLLIQIAARALPATFEHIAHIAIVQRISKNHWCVWLVHPVMVHAVHEYAIHLIVYSGYIIRSH